MKIPSKRQKPVFTGDFDDLNFTPSVGDEVQIFQNETKTIVSKVEKELPPQNPAAMVLILMYLIIIQIQILFIFALFKKSDANGMILV